VNLQVLGPDVFENTTTRADGLSSCL